MRAWGVGILLVCSCLADVGAAEDEALPLPNWEQQEVQIFPLGGGLWPAGSAVPQGAEGTSGDDVRLFIPNVGGDKKGVDGDDKGKGAVPVEEDLVEVGADFFEQHEGMAQGGFVYDPEGVLSDGVRDELSRLLGHQAESAKVAAHFVMMEGRQRLPQEVDLSKLAGADLMGGLSCLVVYPMGEPWRVRLFMSRKVTEVVRPEYLRVMARACIQDALKVTDAGGQLERFAIQLSIRLTWLEREHALPELRVATVDEGAEVAEMPEVTGPEKVVERVSFMQVWWGKLRPWVLMLGGGLVGLVAVILGGRWGWRRLMRRDRVVVWLLPEVNVKPRLGGKHCGGGGAAVRY